MDVIAYISALGRVEHLGSYLGLRDKDILLEFSRAPVLSTYKIFSMLKKGETFWGEQGEPMAYKNARIHVKNLESLGFIKKVKQKNPTKHGAIYYQISEAGMFRLMLKPELWVSDLVLPSILDSHGNYAIFQTFLYSCFKRETVTAICTEEVSAASRIVDGVGVRSDMQFIGIVDAIINYLQSTCEEIMSLRERNPDIEAQKKNLEYIEFKISLLKGVLVAKIFLFLRHHDKTDQKALSILVNDERFMKIARDLQKDVNSSLDTAMRLRNRLYPH